VRDDDFLQRGAGRSRRARAAARKAAAREAAARRAAERKRAARRAAGRGGGSRKSFGRRPVGRPQPPEDLWSADQPVAARRDGLGGSRDRDRGSRGRGGRDAADPTRPGGPAPRGAKAPGPGPRRRTAKPARRPRRGPPPALYFGAATVLVLALVAGAAVMIMGGRSDQPSRDAPVRRPAPSGVAPAAYSDSPSTRVFAGIDRRAADAKPLTVGEVFPRAARTLPDKDARARLTLADARLDGDCAAAIWGLELGEELRRAGCTQVVRGAYVDKKAGYTAMVAIFNLGGAAQANRVVDALGNNSVSGFILPLPQGDRFDQGFSLARGRAMGHYGVVGWVRRQGGGGDEQDTALLSLLVTLESPKAVLDRAAAARTSAASRGATG
jgi:hypothetical protein